MAALRAPAPPYPSMRSQGCRGHQIAVGVVRGLPPVLARLGYQNDRARHLQRHEEAVLAGGALVQRGSLTINK